MVGIETLSNSWEVLVSVKWRVGEYSDSWSGVIESGEENTGLGKEGGIRTSLSEGDVESAGEEHEEQQEEAEQLVRDLQEQVEFDGKGNLG
ncbi:hypothetical protein Pcinc_038146 [Petrolisthes cinctipes]|uniref:Uncharacterized protein n=1 Tax=Petrolisthes cinctipes TaxID=88211 RepID=A0AAE1BUC3_PETCI|nr:hypothetical protein Pcinc_038146 [Petrolisthes cinctipes]